MKGIFCDPLRKLFPISLILILSSCSGPSSNSGTNHQEQNLDHILSTGPATRQVQGQDGQMSPQNDQEEVMYDVPVFYDDFSINFETTDSDESHYFEASVANHSPYLLLDLQVQYGSRQYPDLLEILYLTEPVEPGDEEDDIPFISREHFSDGLDINQFYPQSYLYSVLIGDMEYLIEYQVASDTYTVIASPSKGMEDQDFEDAAADDSDESGDSGGFDGSSRNDEDNDLSEDSNNRDELDDLDEFDDDFDDDDADDFEDYDGFDGNGEDDDTDDDSDGYDGFDEDDDDD